MPSARTVLLADADVLIDYRESELGILELVVAHVGQVAVLAPVLGEVGGVTAAQCARLGIEVVEVETEQMMLAAELESSVSFNDRLCLVTCREESWTCVTNDGALRRLCERHGVETRFGLGLMVDLVAPELLHNDEPWPWRARSRRRTRSTSTSACSQASWPRSRSCRCRASVRPRS